jgi:PAS domain S-box-containing protein
VDNSFIFITIAVVALLLGVTWWYAQSTSHLLQQAQNQVAAMERQVIGKIEELQKSYTQLFIGIEERQKTEEKLKVSEARFAAFMRHLPGTASMQDAQGRYLFANETWEKVFGLRFGDCWGKTPEEVWSQNLSHSLLETDQRHMEGGQPIERIQTLEQEGLRHFWLINKFPIMNQDDQEPMVGTIGIDITARRQAEEALRENEQKLRYLTEQLLFAQENERKRLATELHDELGHSLLILKMRMESLEEELPTEQVSLKNEVKKMLHFIINTIGEVRRLYLDLSPGDLEDLGLTAALNSLIEDFVLLQKNIAWSVKVENLDEIFSLPIQTVIYRVVQECLTNIGKHAHPSQVSLEIAKAQDKVIFMVNDNGEGFDRDRVSAEKKTLGLLSMEERIKILGGAFELFSQPELGTRITFTIPLPKEEAPGEHL